MWWVTPWGAEILRRPWSGLGFICSGFPLSAHRLLHGLTESRRFLEWPLHRLFLFPKVLLSPERMGDFL